MAGAQRSCTSWLLTVTALFAVVVCATVVLGEFHHNAWWGTRLRGSDSQYWFLSSSLIYCTLTPSLKIYTCTLMYIRLCVLFFYLPTYSGQTLPPSSAANGPIRLWRNGATLSSYTFGRVQLVYNRQWGNICYGVSFGITEATVICHQLGYTGASSQSRASIDT